MLLDDPTTMTVEDLLKTCTAKYDERNKWDGWHEHHIDFKVGKGTAELHSEHDAFRMVYSVHVHEKHRGKGHGKRLMDAIVAYADLTHVGLRLHVLIDNEPAIRLYHSVGFKVVYTSESNGTHLMQRYPTHIPTDSPMWIKHFENKVIHLEREHEPRLGGDFWVAFFDAEHEARERAYARDEKSERVRYSGSKNYEENTRRLYCDLLGEELTALGWTITRTTPSCTTNSTTTK